MDGDSVIHFLVDESVRYPAITAMLRMHQHTAEGVRLSDDDASIIRLAEEHGHVVVTADLDFGIALLRFPTGHPSAYRRTGVVQLPNNASDGLRLLEEWLPLVEVVWRRCQARASRRFLIDLTNPNQLRIRFGNDAKPVPPPSGSSERQAEKRRRRTQRRELVESPDQPL